MDFLKESTVLIRYLDSQFIEKAADERKRKVDFASWTHRGFLISSLQLKNGYQKNWQPFESFCLKNIEIYTRTRRR